jgi:hypothetical protein
MIARLRRHLRPNQNATFAPKEHNVGGGRLAAQAHVIVNARPLDAQDSTETTGKGFKYVSVGRVQR